VKLLLDTHIILWSVAEPDRIPKEVIKELESKSNELWFSPISVWEILVLAQKGRIAFSSDITKTIRTLFKKTGFKEAKLNFEVALQSHSIALPHKDPADRFITATASVYGLTLVTADNKIIASNPVSILSASP
jgi:PIN domain nuclease of toxin-antitoxin system